MLKDILNIFIFIDEEFKTLHFAFLADYYVSEKVLFDLRLAQWMKLSFKVWWLVSFNLSASQLRASKYLKINKN